MDCFEILREALGDTYFLDELERALSTDQKRDLCEWIARNNDVALTEDEDE